MKEFKLIVAGGRDFDNEDLLNQGIEQVLAELPDDVSVSIVSGMARGADRLGYEYAKKNGVTVYPFYADWKSEPRRAGYIRNQDMANNSDGLLAFWDGISKGTRHMIAIARQKGMYVKVISY
jgi:hypothetical protein